MLGNKLDFATVFIAMQYFNHIKWPLTHMPTIYTRYISFKTSMDRIEKFMSSAEV